MLPIIARGKGGIVVDVDGNEYIDLIGGRGSLILGHADERVVAAITKAASKGSGCGALSEAEVRLAELIVGRVPGAE
ncbi:MAG: aminotransferase class III-fold pyridoxal phosphate-dependent enzyme, partial [Phycisphaerae bacterium]